MMDPVSANQLVRAVLSEKFRLSRHSPQTLSAKPLKLRHKLARLLLNVALRLEPRLALQELP
jgi:hypothetical protein